MGILEFCIRRPVFATVLSLILVLLGLVSFQLLTVREFPNVDEPIISVTTDYPGASATIVETQVTQILEGSIAGIEGIDVLESTSRSESSRITVRFRPEVDPDVAASDVRDRVARVRGRLPEEITEPVEPGDHRLHRPLRDRSAENANRRRRRADLRRAPLCHARVD